MVVKKRKAETMTGRKILADLHKSEIPQTGSLTQEPKYLVEPHWFCSRKIDGEEERERQRKI